MNDLISTQCPNCGGKLQLSDNAKTLSCESCGTEHLIRRSAEGITLETHAKCPLCNRNDNVKKVSAILREQTTKTKSISYQNVVTYQRIGTTVMPLQTTVAVPSESSETSELANLLQPPGRPSLLCTDTFRKFKSYFYITFILFGIAFLYCLISLPSLIEAIKGTDLTGEAKSDLMILFVPIGLLIISGLITLFVGIPHENKQNMRRKLAYMDQQRIIAEQHQRELERWDKAFNRWKQLYYCNRDDCIFMPDSGSYAPISYIRDYLYCDDVKSFKLNANSTYTIAVGGKNYYCPDRSTLLAWFQSGRVLTDTDIYDHSAGIWKKVVEVLNR